MTFILILYILLLYHFIYRTHVKDKSKTFCFWTAVVMFLISSLRHEAVGNDTYAYMQHFENFNMTWGEIWQNFLLKYMTPSAVIGKDPGIDVFDKVVGYIIPNGRWYISLVSLITIGTIAYFIYDNAKTLRSVCFSFIFFATLFYQYIPNSAVRQSIAMVCLLWGYKLLKNRKFWQFAVMVLLASTFHKSALIGITMLPLMFTKRIKVVYLFALMGFIMVLLFPNQIALFLGGENEVYASYVGGDYYNRANRPVMIIFLILILFILTYFILIKDEKLIENRIYYYGCALTFLSVPLIWVDPSALRLISYFGLFMPLLIGNEIDWYLPNSKMIYAVIVLAFFLKNMFGNDNYHFMWQEMELHDRYGYVEPHRELPKAVENTYYLA